MRNRSPAGGKHSPQKTYNFKYQRIERSLWEMRIIHDSVFQSTKRTFYPDVHGTFRFHLFVVIFATVLFNIPGNIPLFSQEAQAPRNYSNDRNRSEPTAVVISRVELSVTYLRSERRTPFNWSPVTNTSSKSLRYTYEQPDLNERKIRQPHKAPFVRHCSVASHSNLKRFIHKATVVKVGIIRWI